MKKRLIFSILILIIMAWAGCANTSPPAALPDENGAKTNSVPDPSLIAEPDQTVPSLGRIHLGMNEKDVTDLLGSDYMDRLEEEPGYFGESFIIRHYPRGCDLVIGQSSRKVLQMDVSSSDYPTNLGVKVGDASMGVIQHYRQLYPEYVGNQSSEILPGWFLVEPGTLIIFSSRENRERDNRNLTQDSKITAITLGSTRYFD